MYVTTETVDGNDSMKPLRIHLDLGQVIIIVHTNLRLFTLQASQFLSCSPDLKSLMDPISHPVILNYPSTNSKILPC